MHSYPFVPLCWAWEEDGQAVPLSLLPQTFPGEVALQLDSCCCDPSYPDPVGKSKGGSLIPVLFI